MARMSSKIFLLIPIAVVSIVVISLGIDHMRSAVHNVEGLEVMEDSFISLVNGKALLHLKNLGRECVVITRFEIKGFGIVRKIDSGSSIGLFSNGVWIDRRTGEVGLNIGEEGYVILDLSNIIGNMTEGKTYTLLMYTRKHGVFEAYLKAKTLPIPRRILRTVAITITLSKSG